MSDEHDKEKDVLSTPFTLPKPRPGPQAVTKYNAEILDYMKQGMGTDRIYAALAARGIKISRSTVGKRITEIRAAYERGGDAAVLGESASSE